MSKTYFDIIAVRIVFSSFPKRGFQGSEINSEHSPLSLSTKALTPELSITNIIGVEITSLEIITLLFSSFSRLLVIYKIIHKLSENKQLIFT